MMDKTSGLGVSLAIEIDWSGFGPVCQTVYCSCDAVFRSHHKLYIVGEKMKGVSMEPCPQCGSHLNARRISSDPEVWQALRAETG